jgi:protein SCO1/2
MRSALMRSLPDGVVHSRRKSAAHLVTKPGFGYLFAPLVLLVTLLAPVQRGLAHEGGNTPPSEITIEERLNAQLPLELEFFDESGGKVTLGNFFNSRPVLLAFVYYECAQVCPLVLDGLARSLRVLNLTDQQYEVVIVSIDPGETYQVAAAKKKEYSTRFGGPERAPRWHFLTGAAASVEQLTHAAGFGYVKEAGAKAQYVHPAASLVVTPGGRISRYLYGFDYAPKDLRFALIEASGNRIGSTLDRLLLLCYQYDPAKGKYTLAVLNILRVLAGATIVAMAAFLITMMRRERARAALGGAR